MRSINPELRKSRTSGQNGSSSAQIVRDASVSGTRPGSRGSGYSVRDREPGGGWIRRAY
ncbi:uncharacterized protein EI90DRAFT_3095363 [Cantharellus anzutake]|uniref:uncharacterized protein n=1 Tax=Cantharellus anzutake TaxID=1750568 RepID=UPI0019067462|nr:uncharacterized protein EI90DRAFT_3095363 [Cantharellus anzutake]KAF8311792.1 hypothetical protein EI90DRAFT_3095363 [Cantharellus anzutake]